MRKLWQYSQIILLLSILWMVLMETFDIKNALLGAVIGTTALIFTDNLLLMKSYQKSYNMNLSTLIRYIGFLIFQIYLSGLSSIRQIITGKTNVKIIDYKTSLNNELMICLLSNSITLTPGTVVIDKKGNVLKILCLNYPKENEKQEIVSKKMENILKSSNY